MTTEVRRPLRIRTVALAVCALILAWFVISRSFAAYLAEVSPHSALWLNAWEPTALVILADQGLNLSQGDATPAQSVDQPPNPQKNAAGGTVPVVKNAAPDSRNESRDFSEFRALGHQGEVDLPAVRALAKASLMSAPLNARALRVLGQVADAAGRDADAAKFMHMATQLSLHESIAIYWLLVQSATARDYKNTVYYADIILRTLPGFDTYVSPILARVAEDKKSVSLLKMVLNADPPWRSIFLQDLPRDVTDERVPLDLLLSLRASSKPPTIADVNSYLTFLVQHRMYELAYYSWLQFLSAEELRRAGLPYDGNFEAAPTGSPFDWIITEGAGVNVDIEERPDKRGDHALVVDFEYGRVEYHSVHQLIMLAPGRYHFDGQYKGELVGPRGLKWRIACAESSDRPFAETEMIRGSATAWSDTKLDFTIPEQNCRAQYLSLDLDARMPSEEFVTGSVWFDDLRISRVASAPND